MEDRRTDHNNNGGAGIGTLIIRVIVTAIVLAVVAFVTPGFSVSGIWPLIIAAVVIGVIHWLVEKIFKFDASPFGRGITGFIVTAIILWITGLIVTGFSISIIGALIAALVIGIINAIIPGAKGTMT